MKLRLVSCGVAYVAAFLCLNVPTVLSQSFPIQQDLEWSAQAAGRVVQWRSDAEQWAAVALLGAAVIGYGWDSAAVAAVQRWQSPAADRVFGIAKIFGEGVYWALGSVLLYGIGGLTEQSAIREIGREAFVALLLTGAVTTVGKMVLGRARPYTGEGPEQFRWFETENAYLSMPSGHTSTAFALAGYAARKINQWWSYALFLPVAALTGLSRMYHNQHWLSDVFAGAAIGTWIGFSVAASSDSPKSDQLTTLSLVAGVPLRVGVQLHIP